MTTNVYDSVQGVLASDSRWSVTYGSYLVYIDDTGFEKIEILNNKHAFMFAGFARAIQNWKTWIRSNPTNMDGAPDFEGMCVCVVDIEANKVLFSQRQDIVKDGSYFAGSGSRHAALCWLVNKCAKRAIETAKTRDICTGGDVKYFDIKSKTHNLYNVRKDITMEMVRNALVQRGEVMTIATANDLNPPFKKLADLVAANDADAVEISAQLASGALNPQAPCDGMVSEWTAAERSDLTNVFGEVFGWN